MQKFKQYFTCSNIFILHVSQKKTRKLDFMKISHYMAWGRRCIIGRGRKEVHYENERWSEVYRGTERRGSMYYGTRIPSRDFRVVCTTWFVWCTTLHGSSLIIPVACACACVYCTSTSSFGSCSMSSCECVCVCVREKAWGGGGGGWKEAIEEEVYTVKKGK